LSTVPMPSTTTTATVFTATATEMTIGGAITMLGAVPLPQRVSPLSLLLH
jgi:hypothetical protein